MDVQTMGFKFDKHWNYILLIGKALGVLKRRHTKLRKAHKQLAEQHADLCAEVGKLMASSLRHEVNCSDRHRGNGNK